MSLPRSRLQVEGLRKRGELLKFSFRSLLLLSHIASQLLKLDSPMSAHKPAGKVACLDLFHDERTRDVQKIRRVLGREFMLLRHQQHGLALRHLPKHISKKSQRSGGQLQDRRILSRFALSEIKNDFDVFSLRVIQGRHQTLMSHRSHLRFSCAGWIQYVMLFHFVPREFAVAGSIRMGPFGSPGPDGSAKRIIRNIRIIRNTSEDMASPPERNNQGIGSWHVKLSPTWCRRQRTCRLAKQAVRHGDMRCVAVRVEARRERQTLWTVGRWACRDETRRASAARRRARRIALSRSR